MRVRNWAFAAAAVLLLAAALIPTQRRLSEAKSAAKRDTEKARVASRQRPATRPTAVADVDAALQPAVAVPEIASSVGSCIQDDAKGGQVCTDFFGSQSEMDGNKLICRKMRKFQSAVWVDAPCDHAASHGGCWTSTEVPSRIRWFYGENHKDFRPGPDTLKVCGHRSLAYRPDGTAVKIDGTPEPNAGPMAHPAGSGQPAAPPAVTGDPAAPAPSADPQ